MPFPGNTSSEGKKPTPAPLIGTATAGIQNASVPFTVPAWQGKGTITYYATSSPGGIQGTNSTTPISVTGLTAGQPYTFVVNGITNYGVTSDTSSPSNSVTPVAPPPSFPSFTVPSFPSFVVPSFPSFTAPSFPSFPSFSVPSFPSFSAPSFPSFQSCDCSTQGCTLACCAPCGGVFSGGQCIGC